MKSQSHKMMSLMIHIILIISKQTMKIMKQLKKQKIFQILKKDNKKAIENVLIPGLNLK